MEVMGVSEHYGILIALSKEDTGTEFRNDSKSENYDLTVSSSNMSFISPILGQPKKNK